MGNQIACVEQTVQQHAAEQKQNARANENTPIRCETNALHVLFLPEPRKPYHRDRPLPIMPRDPARQGVSLVRGRREIREPSDGEMQGVPKQDEEAEAAQPLDERRRKMQVRFAIHLTES